ncbi:MAG: hypothetical protein QNJ45_16715 [Ardenticatenaceae bacterium]|nr:hypothetical protein [Ardenticatenaceae bacterium]
MSPVSLKKRVTYQSVRRSAIRLFWFALWVGMVQPAAAAERLAPLTQEAEIPFETWVMIGVVATGLLLLGFALFRPRPQVDPITSDES